VSQIAPLRSSGRTVIAMPRLKCASKGWAERIGPGYRINSRGRSVGMARAIFEQDTADLHFVRPDLGPASICATYCAKAASRGEGRLDLRDASDVDQILANLPAGRQPHFFANHFGWPSVHLAISTGLIIMHCIGVVFSVM